MRGRVERIDRVRRDLLLVFTILSRSSPRSAYRFLDAAEKTFLQLADMPGMGEAYHFEESEVPGLRRCLVTGFRNYLIYYFPIEGGVKILRVVHGARDTQDLLDPEDVE